MHRLALPLLTGGTGVGAGDGRGAELADRAAAGRSGGSEILSVALHLSEATGKFVDALLNRRQIR
jgi:hypothetical protein